MTDAAASPALLGGSDPSESARIVADGARSQTGCGHPSHPHHIGRCALYDRDPAVAAEARAQDERRLRGSRSLAYADPPYLGCCRLYDHHHPDGPMPWDGRCWDDPETHRALLTYLSDEFDGWAYSMTSGSLHTLLPFAPGARIASWNKPFAAFKRNVRIAYTWEPVLFVPGRDRSKDGAPVGRDHLAESIVMRKGLTGTKPEKFCKWVLDLLGYVEGDEVTDLFPGLNPMGRTLASIAPLTDGVAS